MFQDWSSEEKPKSPEAIALEIAMTQAEIAGIKKSDSLLDEEIAFVNAEIEPLDKELNEIRALMTALEEKRRKANEKRRNIKQKADNAIWKKGSNKTQVDQKTVKINKLKSALHKAQQDELKTIKLAEQGEQLEELAKTFAWYPQYDDAGNQVSGAYSHQLDAAKQMTVLGKVILGDDMGLGKSLTSLMTADLAKAKRVLIVSKIDIIQNFENEIRKWAPHRKMVYSAVGKKKSFNQFQLGNILPRFDEFVVLINFESWWSNPEIISLLIGLQFDMVIFDEAHHMKEAKKKTFSGFKKIVRATNKCKECSSQNVNFQNQYLFRCEDCKTEQEPDEARSIRNVYPMTGSPILNRPDEIWPMLNIIDSAAFPDIQTFRTQYCTKVGYYNLRGTWAWRWTFDIGGSDKLLREIGPQFIRRTKEDAGIKLPPQEVVVHRVPFNEETHPDQWRAYQDIEEYFGSMFAAESDEGAVVATTGSTIITRLRQITSWPAGIVIPKKDYDGKPTGEIDFQCDVHESAKLDAAFDEVVEKFQNGERVIFFAKHVAVLEEMKRRLDEWESEEEDQRIRSVMYYGKTPYSTRERIKIDFDASRYDPENYEWDVVVCQNDSASQGVNFTAATHMCVVERMWNPKLEEQMFARTRRIGQTKQTTVSIFELEDTVDTAIADLLYAKKTDVAAFEESSEAIQKLLEALFKKAKKNEMPAI